MANEKTSKRVGRIASKVLRTDSSKNAKSAAGPEPMFKKEALFMFLVPAAIIVLGLVLAFVGPRLFR